MHPTHMARTPYIFHFQGQSVAMGEPRFLQEIEHLLREAGEQPRPTFWNQQYLVDALNEYPALLESGVEGFGASGPGDLLNSVGTDLGPEEFWEAIDRGVFRSTEWPVGNAPLFLGQRPDWLEHARSWEFDPVAPPDGPGELGGWTRLRGREESGQPVGMFQLTDPDSFWVLGSADDLDDVMNLCRELAGYREGFDLATAYFDETARYSSIALPLRCKQPLQEEFFIAGVDCEPRFWE